MVRRTASYLFVAMAALFAITLGGGGSGSGQSALASSPAAPADDAPPNVGIYWAGPEAYSKVKELGANVVVSNFANDTEVRLFWAQRQGIELLLFNSAWIDDSVYGGRANTDLICKNVSEVKNSPALFGYYVVDEPSKHPTPVSVSTMQAVNATVKKCDPNHPTVAVFLPGSGFGSSSNNFGANIADVVMFDIYPKGPGNSWNPSWISSHPLPAAIDVVRSRDPKARIWVAVQAFGGCGSHGCFSNVSESQLKEEIDLNFALFKKKGVKLDGLFFFLWDRHFDDDATWLTDDMRSHAEFWKYVDYAADRLPPSDWLGAAAPAVPSRSGVVDPGPADTATGSAPAWPAPTSGLCSDFTPAGAIQGTITKVSGDAIEVGGRTFRVNDFTSVLAFTSGQEQLGRGFLQRGAFVKAFAQNRSTFSRPACKVLVKAVSNLKFTIVDREDLGNGGLSLTVEDAEGSTPFSTVEVNGVLPTQIKFSAPPGQPAMTLSNANLQRGSLVQVVQGYVGGAASNLRATSLTVLPLNSGLSEVVGSNGAGSGLSKAWEIVPADDTHSPYRSVEVGARTAVYFSGKDGSGRKILRRLPATAVQPLGLYTFLGSLEDNPRNMRTNVAYQVPQNFWGIVTATKRGGLGLKVMGPDLPNPDKTVFSMQMRGAKTYVQLDNGRPPIKVGQVRNYSIGLFTGYFVGVNTFQVTQAVFYYIANPTP